MASTVEQIRRDLAAIEAATATLADQFQAHYQNYLQALGKAAQRQLILASYHLCTQVYPEAFLRLSLSQRQKLQAALRGLGKELSDRITVLLDSSLDTLQAALLEAEAGRRARANRSDSEEDTSQSGDENTGDETSGENSDGTSRESSAEFGEQSSGDSTGAEDTGDESTGDESTDDESTDDENTGSLDDDDDDSDPFAELPMMRAMLVNAVLEAMEPDSDQPEDPNQPLTPARLMRRHVLLEQRIHAALQRTSNRVNRLLQQAEMLPDLPEAVLLAATEADIPIEKVTAPNLLNVLVAMSSDAAELLSDRADEAARDAAADSDADPDPDDEADEAEDGDDEDDERNMTHLIAIHLRLSDIEFADAQASLWRSRLREAVGKLKQLGNHYQKKQQERAIAEAELAWRSTWYDDTSQA